MADIEDIIRGAEARFIEADAQARVCFVVKCEHAGCAHELLVPRPKLKGGATREKAAKTPAFINAIEHAMARAGWTFRRNRARPLCPEHHPRITYAPKEPAPVAITEIPRNDIAVPPPQGSLPPRPTPTREPTRADNQRIHEELAVAYDDVACRYKSSASDASVATKLDVPRLWVSTIRKGFFGEHDRNEAAEDDKAISAAMDLLAEADSKTKAARANVDAANTWVHEAAGLVSRARAMLDGIRRAR